MKLTTKPEFNTAFPHSSSLVSTTQDLNNAHVRNGHIKPSVWSLHSHTLLSSPLKINLLRKRTFISFPLLPYPFPTHRFLPPYHRSSTYSTLPPPQLYSTITYRSKHAATEQHGLYQPSHTLHYLNVFCKVHFLSDSNTPIYTNIVR